jgi:hypothetical protein
MAAKPAVCMRTKRNHSILHLTGCVRLQVGYDGFSIIHIWFIGEIPSRRFPFRPIT